MDHRATDDVRLLGFRCLELCGEMEELLTARGGVGKGLGEKIHSLKSTMSYELVGRLLQIVSVRNTIGHEAHKRMFAADELRSTIDDCERALNEVRALPAGGARHWHWGAAGRGSAWQPRRRFAPGPVGSFRGPRSRGSSGAVALVFAVAFVIFVFVMISGGRGASDRLLNAVESSFPSSSLSAERASSGTVTSSRSSSVVSAPARPPAAGSSTSPLAGKRSVLPTGARGAKTKTIRHGKRDPWDELVEETEAAGTREPERAVTKRHLTPEEVDAVLGQ